MGDLVSFVRRAQVVDHKEILKLKPSETAAKNLEDHVGAAADVKMWEPLWPQPHRKDEHVVMGLALNYDIRYVLDEKGRRVC